MRINTNRVIGLLGIVIGTLASGPVWIGGLSVLERVFFEVLPR
jgi:hypothetical protein